MSKRTCDVERCDKPSRGRYCAMHWARLKRHGTLDLPPRRLIPACSVEGCQEVAASIGLCSRHYQRRRKHPIPGGPECSIIGCDRPKLTRGFCSMHYARWQRHGDPAIATRMMKPRKVRSCQVAGCARPYLAMGYCKRHYRRWRANGDAVLVQVFHGRGSINASGYRMVPAAGHPNAHENGQVAEHRLVMARLLGRPLFASEEVHHKNGDRLDNRPANLELWIKDHPSGQRVDDMLAWAHDLIARYEAIPDTAAAV